MSIENSLINRTEAEPQHTIVMVNFFRHGKTQYIENTTTPEEREKMRGQIPTMMNHISDFVPALLDTHDGKLRLTPKVVSNE